MNKSFLFSLLITFSLGQLYCQSTKFDEKLISKLNEKYDFVSIKKGMESKHYDRCDKILVGDFMYGPNDGGGSPVIGAKNLKYINSEGKEIEESPIFNIYGVNNSSYHQILMAKYPDGLVGLIDLCGNVIMEAKYREINQFNDSGLAVAFIGNTIDIIDTTGNSLLDKTINYEVDYERFHVYPGGSYLSALKVVNGKFFQRGTNKLLALYDVIIKKNLTDYKYDFFNLNFIENDGVKYFKVKKGDKFNLVDINSGKELIAGNGYFDIRNFRDFFRNKTVEVLTNKETNNWNLLQLTDNKLLFPTNISIVSFVEKNINGGTKKWASLDHGKEVGQSLFDLEFNQYIIEPKKEYKDFKCDTDFIKAETVVIKLIDDSIQLFDLQSKVLRNLSISGKKLNIDSLKFKDGKIWFKTYSDKLFDNYREITIFNASWNEIYSGVAISSIKNELLEISESTDTKSTKRPYLLNSNGDPVEYIKN